MGLLYKSDLPADRKKSDPQKTAVALPKNVEKEIAAYSVRHSKLSGLVFDIPHNMTKEEANILSGLIKGTVSSIGIAVNLHADLHLTRTLVLIPASLDKELVPHRICANFQTKNCAAFSVIGTEDLQMILKTHDAYSPAAVTGTGAPSTEGVVKARNAEPRRLAATGTSPRSRAFSPA
jgi:hypothetical protein